MLDYFRVKDNLKRNGQNNVTETIFTTNN